MTSMGGPIVVGPLMVHTSDLFVRFNAICGGCHVEASTGGNEAYILGDATQPMR